MGSQKITINGIDKPGTLGSSSTMIFSENQQHFPYMGYNNHIYYLRWKYVFDYNSFFFLIPFFWSTLLLILCLFSIFRSINIYFNSTVSLKYPVFKFKFTHKFVSSTCRCPLWETLPPLPWDVDHQDRGPQTWPDGPLHLSVRHNSRRAGQYYVHGQR